MDEEAVILPSGRGSSSLEDAPAKGSRERGEEPGDLCSEHWWPSCDILCCTHTSGGTSPSDTAPSWESREGSWVWREIIKCSNKPHLLVGWGWDTTWHWTKKAALSPLAKESLFPAVLGLVLGRVGSPILARGAHITGTHETGTHSSISSPAFLSPILLCLHVFCREGCTMQVGWADTHPAPSQEAPCRLRLSQMLLHLSRGHHHAQGFCRQLAGAHARTRKGPVGVQSSWTSSHH